ncbi:MAG: hypothetical protein IT167_26160 [Bryobacterales bacterium]|nr:hypothetical protein [Bryobacterales bacterium]
MRYRKIQVMGGRGSAQDQFSSTLYSLAVDSHDRLYAAGDSGIKVFDSQGKLERRWATAKPVFAVAVAGSGMVYAGEKGQVEIFHPTGKLADTWREAQLLGRVSAIGFHKDSVLVGDAAHRSIRHFEKGVYRNTIGANNRTSGLLIPNGAVSFGIDSDGVIHTANPGKHRVERYTVSDQLLGHIGRFGNDPAGFPGCCNPTNVAVAGRDRIYVTEKAGPRVKAYDFQGNLISVIAADEFDGNCKNMAIAVNGRGRVYVADTVRLQILAFSPEG